MLKRFCRIISACLILLLLTLTSCSADDEQPAIEAEVGSIVLRVGDKKISLGKTLVILLGQKDVIEESYSSKLWNVSYEGAQLGEHLKSRLKTNVALIFVGAGLAESEKISLSSDEKTLVSSATDYFYSKLSDSDKKELNVSRADIYDIISSYRLSVTGYDRLTNEAETEISKDDARVIKLNRISVYKSGMSGADLSLKKAAINEAYKALLSGADFNETASKYDEGGSTEFYSSRGQLSETEEKIAFSLSQGQISEPFETEDSFVIFRCVDSYDEAKSEAARRELLLRRKNDYYIESVKKYLEENPLIWNEDLWNGIDITSISYKTDISFFKVYDMFFPEAKDGGN